MSEAGHDPERDRTRAERPCERETFDGGPREAVGVEEADERDGEHEPEERKRLHVHDRQCGRAQTAEHDPTRPSVDRDTEQRPERDRPEHRADLVRQQARPEDPVEAEAERARDEEAQERGDPRGPAAETERPRQERERQRERHEAPDPDDLQRARVREHAEGRDAYGCDEAGQSGTVEQELVESEVEPGEPTVEAAVCEQL